MNCQPLYETYLYYLSLEFSLKLKIAGSSSKSAINAIVKALAVTIAK